MLILPGSKGPGRYILTNLPYVIAMSGYIGCKMSKNAAKAYCRGKKPISKWTKKDILSTISAYLEEDPQKSQKLTLFGKCRLKILKDRVLCTTEWHHTGGYYNMTDFYEVDEYKVLYTSLQELTSWAEEQVEELKSSGFRRGTIDYLEWYGTRAHPKARDRRLEDVFIEERGSFYYVYDPRHSNKLILKKKIGSNGTFVSYRND